MFGSQSDSFQYRGPFPPALPSFPPPPLNNPWMAQCMPPANGVPFFQPPGPPPNQGYNVNCSYNVNWQGMRPRGRGRSHQQQVCGYFRVNGKVQVTILC